MSTYDIASLTGLPPEYLDGCDPAERSALNRFVDRFNHHVDDADRGVELGVLDPSSGLDRLQLAKLFNEEVQTLCDIVAPRGMQAMLDELRTADPNTYEAPCSAAFVVAVTRLQEVVTAAISSAATALEFERVVWA